MMLISVERFLFDDGRKSLPTNLDGDFCANLACAVETYAIPTPKFKLGESVPLVYLADAFSVLEDCVIAVARRPFSELELGRGYGVCLDGAREDWRRNRHRDSWAKISGRHRKETALQEISIMNVPDDLLYTESHEWIKREGENLRVGITDHAQSELTGSGLRRASEDGSAGERERSNSRLSNPLRPRVTFTRR